MKCNHCEGTCIRKGRYKTTQLYRCKNCEKYQRENYQYHSYRVKDKILIILTKESCGIRSIGRILNISPSTILRRILRIANGIENPMLHRHFEPIQVDEMFTYVGNKRKRICIAYSYHPSTKSVLNFIVGGRNKKNLKRVIQPLLAKGCSKIITDKLNIYKEIIPSKIHSTIIR